MKVNRSEFIVNHTCSETKYYTKKGYETFIDEDNSPRIDTECERVFAKAIKNKPSKNFADKDRMGFSYYIKSTPNKTLYNPVENFSIDGKVARSFINKICKSELIFIEVTESIFNMYINFLKTENNQWLIKAQREIK